MYRHLLQYKMPGEAANNISTVNDYKLNGDLDYTVTSTGAE